MKYIRKKYKIRQDKFIPFVLLLAIILLILVLIAKCSVDSNADKANGGGILAAGLVYDTEEGNGSQSKTDQNQTNPADSLKASRLNPEISFVKSPSMIRMPQPQAPKPRDPNADCFENSAFLGNSCLEGLRNFGLIDNTVYLTKVGLTVKTAYEKARAGSNEPIMVELWGEPQYDSIYVMFGENELGWINTDIFIQSYGQLIDDVKERQPCARIYVQSVLPVSVEASAKNRYNANNARIEEYNGLIKTMCQEKRVTYLDVASALKDENGCLPDDASVDGIHPNKEYCRIWVDYIRSVV